MDNIRVIHAEPKDALGQPRPGCTILDKDRLCGRYQTELEANKQAAAIRKIRLASTR